MIYLLKYDDYKIDPRSNHTKPYQYLEMVKIAKRYDAPGIVVGDIGGKTNFNNLNKFVMASSRITIDPYNGAPGRGLSQMPQIPYPFALFRCEVGFDSECIPSELFDFTFSISVIEHIGQREAGGDCKPTNAPPIGQERKRDKFARELYRITKPGGFTIHTVDHAARNLTLVDNFKNAGFVLIDESTRIPTVDDCLHDSDAVRQRNHWTETDTVLADQELHSCLLMGFKRPK